MTSHPFDMGDGEAAAYERARQLLNPVTKSSVLQRRMGMPSPNERAVQQQQPPKSRLKDYSEERLRNIQAAIESELADRYTEGLDEEYVDEEYVPAADEQDQQAIEPVPDAEVPERKAVYDARTDENLSPAARRAAELVAGVARQVAEQ
jgi:hypothetical protein